LDALRDPETIFKLDAQGLFPVGECGEAAAASQKSNSRTTVV
jgi:hypothetical protein